ncbi:MAG: hypothetical protein IH905_08825 [Proteobacteria bacterium]|nr:hypothetical protein [Pseudomonadota bacterium]
MNTGNNGPAGQPASGPGETAKATTPTIEHPDAALLALDQRYLDFQTKWRAAADDDVSGAWQLKMYEVEKQIASTPAQTLIGVALKVAHLDDALDTGASDWDLETFKTATDALDRLTDFRLLRLEQEHSRLMNRGDNTPGGLPESELDAIVARMEEIQQEVARTIAVTPADVAAKLRLLHDGFESLKTVWGEQGWDSCLASLASMAGTPTLAPPAMPIGADTALFSLADECDRLHEIWRKSCEAYSDAEGAMFDKKRRDEPISDAERAKVKEAEERNDVDQSAYNSIEKRLLNTPAHTPQGLDTKVRIFRRYHANTSGVAAFVDEFVAIAERASPGGNPDAELQSLWREYVQNREDWNKTDEDTPEYERCGEESDEIERRISATPAQGIHGLAVKLMLAADDLYDHKTLADQEALDDRALVSARDDAVRLTGIGGAS